MRTATWETAPQIAPINCSKEVGGGGCPYICDLGEEGVHAIKCIILQKASASHKEQISP